MIYDPEYQPQIEALVAHDFDEFYKLLGMEGKRPRQEGPADELKHAWASTGSNPRSLFAGLPTMTACASTVENRVGVQDLAENALYYIELFGLEDENSRKLSCFWRGPLDDLRGILEEFARRQTLAKTHPYTPEKSNAT